MASIQGQDPLAQRLEVAMSDSDHWSGFLGELASEKVSVLLRQAPGEGAAAPWRNLVLWRHAATATEITPVFTTAGQFPHALPPPAVLVRVPMRELLSITDHPPLLLNPLSPASWMLTPGQCDEMRAILAGQGLSAEQPRPEAPWAFRFPPDEAYPIAESVAQWVSVHEDVDTVYMYTVVRPNVGPDEILVLGVDRPADPGLAERLRRAARQGGADDALLVRFLPDEPSHRAAVEGMRLPPFYRRPTVSALRPTPDDAQARRGQ